MVKEWTKIDRGTMPGKPVVVPIDVGALTYKEKGRALEAVNLIKDKRDGKIKGRTCADAIKQKIFLKEDESIALPAVSVEGLLTTIVIDDIEKREVATFEVLGACLHALVPEEDNVVMKLRGNFVDTMCEVSKTYESHVTCEKGKKLLCLKALRAICRCVQSSLPWHELFSQTLIGMGFVINSYDKCVSNKMIDGN